ncbi:phosphatidate cytidylyltransferase [mine drainage metagenome]|uniref:Phosphatidate cytidylyltransferase n=1 Tax=mine drainage metagenome TaxID=410659 RepID=A0A1J5S944_9ZZZZ
MAFNLQTFKTRTLTAIVFAVVMLSGLLINQWTFFILFTIIHFGCWIEYQKLIGLIDEDYKQIDWFHKYSIMLLGFCFMMWMTNYSYKINRIELQGIGWLVGLIIAILFLGKEIVFKKQLNIKLIGYSLLGLIYISLSWGLMMSIRNIGMVFKFSRLIFDFGMIYPLIIIVSIWINDTMAYIVGSFIGKTPLSKISPKKTWEGTVGGVILSVTVIGLISYLITKNIDVNILIIALIAAVAGTFGDLLESKIKRMANVKDSGSFMPGHGGFLDRFDSLLIATPFVWLFIKLFV